jgi:hypothetical protein
MSSTRPIPGSKRARADPGGAILSVHRSSGYRPES